MVPHNPAFRRHMKEASMRNGNNGMQTVKGEGTRRPNPDDRSFGMLPKTGNLFNGA